MSDSPIQGTWLLLDAAGPELIVGLVQDGQWRARRRNSGGYLEALRPSVEAILSEQSCRLPDLSGALYGSGPGSTLGLRLAAMFLRTLVGLPGLGHWKSFSYHNLVLTGTGLMDRLGPRPVQILAPWKRNRLHRAVNPGTAPDAWSLDTVSPGEADLGAAFRVNLGNRSGNDLPGTPVPYPVEAIPALLRSHSGLLSPVSAPAPFQSTVPEFALWEPERHRAR
jgi:hypothetical protein